MNRSPDDSTPPTERVVEPPAHFEDGVAVVEVGEQRDRQKRKEHGKRAHVEQDGVVDLLEHDVRHHGQWNGETEGHCGYQRTG